MTRLAAALALLVGGTLPASVAAAENSSVLVQTIAAKQGEVPDTITAYGTAAAAPEGSLTLSVPSEGRVLDLAVMPGQAVEAGERLLDFAASPAAISAYQQAVTALTLARTQREHTAQLLAEQLATRDQLSQADKAVADAQSALNALRQQGTGKPVQVVTAPFVGIVSAIPVARGDRVQPGAALITLLRADALVVTAGVEPSDRLRVTAGQTVALDALSGGGRAGGKILRVDSMLNAKTRLVDITIASSASLLPGEAYRAVITVGQFRGWLAPRDAVLGDAQGSYLFQVAGGTARRVAVKIVGSDGDTTVVDGPLDAQQPLIVAGNYQLKGGEAVRAGDRTR